MIELPALELTETQQRTLDMLPPRVAEALLHFRDNMLARFPNDIRRIVLYGSFARGEAHDESDVDVMVVVNWEMPRSPDGRYIYPASDPGRNEILDMAYTATLECERYVSAFVVDEAWYRKDRDAVHEARREGIELYRHLTLTQSLQLENLTARQLKDSSPEDAYAVDPDDLDDIREWLAMANEELQAARVLLSHAHDRQAVSSAYYVMFYAAKAALLAAGVNVKSHEGAISEYGRLFASTGRVEGRFGKMLSDQYEDRLDSDYSLRPKVTRESAERARQNAEAFLVTARELVEDELRRRGAALT